MTAISFSANLGSFSAYVYHSHFMYLLIFSQDFLAFFFPYLGFGSVLAGDGQSDIARSFTFKTSCIEPEVGPC